MGTSLHSRVDGHSHHNQQEPGRGAHEAFCEAWHRQVLADADLDHRPARVASFLVYYINRESLTCWPSLQTIADGTGLDRSGASKALAKLVERGHLRHHARRQSNEYAPVLRQGGVVTTTTATGVGVLSPRQQGVVTTTTDSLKDSLNKEHIYIGASEDSDFRVRQGQEDKQVTGSSSVVPFPSPSRPQPAAGDGGVPPPRPKVPLPNGWKPEGVTAFGDLPYHEKEKLAHFIADALAHDRRYADWDWAFRKFQMPREMMRRSDDGDWS
jgi:hypothetical protein